LFSAFSLPQVPELNVQNGVLKALSFLFEYIGEMGKDYIYAGEDWGKWWHQQPSYVCMLNW
jgi:hypothetical protein